MTLSASVQKLDNKIFRKGEYQAAVAYLSMQALFDLTARDLARQAAFLTTQVLPVENSLVWELSDDRQSLSLIAISGEIESLHMFSPMPLIANSLEEHTLSSPHPILVEEFKDHAQADRHLQNGLSLRIGTIEKPFGVLQVFLAQEQPFSQSDIDFLQSTANLVGLAYQQSLCQSQQVASLEGKISRAKLPPQSRILEWDRYEIKNRLVESQERERRRLAQDLHDAPIQDLYGMIYQLDDLKDVIKDPEGGKILDECEHILHRVVNSLRTICGELRPPSLSPFGLEVAIRDHVEKFRDQNPDIRIHLELMQDKQLLSDSIRLALYRIYQQAIHNIARHAQASDVHIRFRWDQESIVLEVEDNGIGFEVPENWVELVSEEHFGLLGIAERVESIRGKLEIVSSTGNGTLVRAIAPYSRNEFS
jgi:signal transduction histidine kinase